MRKTLLRALLLVVGLGLLGVMLWKVGPEKVWAHITDVGWGFFLLLGLAASLLL